ncbi:NAD(P)/FAD-dependent oxidoreductase [Thioclava kandeliae]|uniref:NAD(P)/FAD-dependent oxidoreductase n=1 Tax=Thioclava kandeliae TaxID=3070818 RepID=A0ABV1SJV8_9RHOB
MSLADLEARLAEDLAVLNLPAAPWVPAREGVTDVLVIGGGMCGLAALAQLRFLGIERSFAVDANPQGFEGPWKIFARMRTLRSPKTLTGPALDQPSLTFRAWFTAQWGRAAWGALDKIPKGQWMDYLRWYRRVLALPVRNDIRLVDLRDKGALLSATLEGPKGQRQVLARRVVLATGRSGLGGGAMPDMLRALPAAYCAHSADGIDFTALKGRRVTVIGAGASAFDTAATALEAGAARVDMLIRRARIPAVNKLTGIGSPGTQIGLGQVPPEWKLKIHAYAARAQVPPPSHSVRRATDFPNAFLHLDCALLGAELQGEELHLQTSRGAFTTDFVISATGFRNDFTDRPELSELAAHIALWRDRGDFPTDLPADGPLGQAPDLAPDFSFIEKSEGRCPALRRIHCFNDAAMLSMGKVSGDIPAVSVGARRLGEAIVAQFFTEDIDAQFARLQAYDKPELLGDEYSATTHLPDIPEDGCPL